MQKKLHKIEEGKKIAGVCTGLADFTGIDVTLIRLALVLFCLVGGSGIVVYLIAALIMPADDGSDGYTPYNDVQ